MMLFSSFSIFGNKKVVFLSMYFKCMCVLNLFTKDDDNQLKNGKLAAFKLTMSQFKCLKITLGKLVPKYEKKNRLTKIKVFPFKTLHTLTFPKILNA